MEDMKLFQIGEVAKMFQISVGTLRHYEQSVLLIPEYTDPQTGYRYYSIRQFEILKTIRYLRVLDMPLNQIADFLHNRDIHVIKDKLQKQKEMIQKYENEIRELNQKIEEFDLVKKQSKDVVHLNEIASFIEEGRADNLEEALYLSSFSDLFREVEKNMASLKQEMEKIHEKVNYLEDDVDDFDYEIEDMKKEFESINEEISGLQSGVNDAIDRADQAYDYAVSNG